MSASHHVNRRSFIKSSAATAVACGAWSSRAAGESNSPNEKLQIAVIGTVNRAAANINGVRGEAIVAISDVDKNYLDKAQSEFPDAKSFTDYRELIDQAGDRIDAVVVSTPDHHHAPATIRAIRAGLHVYCEKPLTHTVEEARLVTEAARARGVVTQLGTQIHAGDNYRRVVEMIRAGMIGDVSEVYVWVGKGWGGRGNDLPTKDEIQTPPEALSWEHWLGPAPHRPFAPGRYHPAQWRRWWQFGGGTLGDMACHYMDLPFWALELKYPTSCKATGPELDPETCPTGITVEYEFPARQQRPPVKLTWYDGDHSLKKISGQRYPAAESCLLDRLEKFLLITATIESSHRQGPTNPNCRNRRFPARSAITPNGLRPARMAHLPPAISTTRDLLPKLCCSETSPTGPVKKSTGMPSGCKRSIALQPTT